MVKLEVECPECSSMVNIEMSLKERDDLEYPNYMFEGEQVCGNHKVIAMLLVGVVDNDD